MCALRHSPSLSALTLDDARFICNIADDTEDAPWMVMNDRQWRSASALFWSLEVYAQSHPVTWHPGAMLPLTYLPPGARRRKQVAPDVFVAPVPVQGRDSLAIDREGMPPFVLEVVWASSVQRDLDEKTELYRILGAREYAIVRLDLDEPRLEGYRQAASGAWEPWTLDGAGRLWSEVLGLGLVLHGGEVRAVTQEGEMLRTLAEETLARQQEALAREQAEAAQRQAEQEVARLRATLERMTRGGKTASEGESRTDCDRR